MKLSFPTYTICICIFVSVLPLSTEITTRWRMVTHTCVLRKCASSACQRDWRHACKFVDHACDSRLVWNAEEQGRRWLQIASITLAVAPLPIPRSAAFARASLRTASGYCVWNDYGGAVWGRGVAQSRTSLRLARWQLQKAWGARGRRDYAPRRAAPRCWAAVRPASMPAGCCCLFHGDVVTLSSRDCRNLWPRSRFRVILAKEGLDRAGISLLITATMEETVRDFQRS